MFQKCMLFTLALFLLAGVYLLDECKGYVRYGRLAWELYGVQFLWMAAILYVDLTCLLYLLLRWLLLQETGRKLVHYEKQLATGESVSEELVRLLQEGKR